MDFSLIQQPISVLLILYQFRTQSKFVDLKNNDEFLSI